MTYKQLKKKTDGFTIIEVLIVLAIAGLIMLIVFLAVPALQRNSRNTQRRTDVSSILGAVQEYAGNNNGKLPAADTDFEGNLNPASYETGNIFLSANPTTYTATVAAASTTATATSVTNNSVTVVTGYKCTTATSSPTKDSIRSVAVVFVVETPTGNGQLQCQSS